MRSREKKVWKRSLVAEILMCFETNIFAAFGAIKQHRVVRRKLFVLQEQSKKISCRLSCKTNHIKHFIYPLEQQVKHDLEKKKKRSRLFFALTERGKVFFFCKDYKILDRKYLNLVYWKVGVAMSFCVCCMKSMSWFVYINTVHLYFSALRFKLLSI